MALGTSSLARHFAYLSETFFILSHEYCLHTRGLSATENIYDNYTTSERSAHRSTQNINGTNQGINLLLHSCLSIIKILH